MTSLWQAVTLTTLKVFVSEKLLLVVCASAHFLFFQCITVRLLSTEVKSDRDCPLALIKGQSLKK